MKASSPYGFTLVELVTVIAVGAILATILVQVASQARRSSEQSVSASHMRQIGIALHLYATDHGGLLPETADSGVDRSWVYTLAPYLDDVEEVLVCPADPKRDERREKKLSSYVVNEYLFEDAFGPFGEPLPSYRNLETLEAPSRTMAVFIGADHLALSASNDHVHTRRWAGYWLAVIDGIQPDRFRTGPPSHYHTDGSAPYLYADGHVATIQAQELKRRIDAGENPARPPEAAD